MSADSLKSKRLSDPNDPPKIKLPGVAFFFSSLAALKVFIPWRLEWDPGNKKWTKRPHRIVSPLEGKGSEWNTDGASRTLQEVLEWISKKPRGRGLPPGWREAGWGVGLLGGTGEGVPVSLDFDDVLDESGRVTNPDLAQWVDSTKDEIFWEKSLSGSGLHAIGFGLEVTGPGQKFPLTKGGSFEVLKDPLYCALTGERFAESSLEPKGIQALYVEVRRDGEEAKASKAKEKKEPVVEMIPSPPQPPPPPSKPKAPTVSPPSVPLRGKELRELVSAAARSYVEKMPQSVEGSGGHVALMNVAVALAHGFGYSDPSRAGGWEQDGYAIFQDYNAQASPPESPEQVEHKWADATKSNATGNDLFAPVLRAFQDFQARNAPLSGSSQSKEKEARGGEGEEDFARMFAGGVVNAWDIPEQDPAIWIWENFIQRGRLGTMSGWPGSGKSTGLSGVCAAITTPPRTYSPCGSLPGHQATSGENVIWITCEEDESLVRDRFELAGGNQDRFFVVNLIPEKDGKLRNFILPKDLGFLRYSISRLRPAMVVLDSMSGIISSEYDIAKSQKVREVLTPLVAMAREFGTAIVFISHFTKGSINREGPELTRSEGSLAVVGATRFALNVGFHPEDKQDDNIPDHEKRRVIFGARISNGEDGWAAPFKTRVMRKEGSKGISKAVIPVWEAASRIGDSAFAPKREEKPKPGPKAEQRGEAGQAILAVIRSRGGWMTSKELEENRKAISLRMSISEDTVERAQSELKKLGELNWGRGPDGAGLVFLPGYDPRPKNGPKATSAVNLEEEILGIVEGHGGTVEEWELINPLNELKIRVGVPKKAIDNARKVLIGSGRLLVSGTGDNKTYRLAGEGKEERSQEKEGGQKEGDLADLADELVL